MDSKLKKWVLGPSENGQVQLFRSLFVGAAATVVDYATLALLLSGLGLNEMIAATAGFLVGLLVNFILSRVWVFTGSRLSGSAEFMAFAVISVIGLGLTLLIVEFFSGFVWDRALLGHRFGYDGYVYAGKAVATVTVFFWNFLMRKFVVYRK